eukprot:scaffold742_cov263-Pinguiococcus_pyrenoidosus.AAC.3
MEYDSLIQLRDSLRESLEKLEDIIIAIEEEEEALKDIMESETAVSPELAKLLGRKEAEIKTDWTPPSESGLHNSGKIKEMKGLSARVQPGLNPTA